MITTKTVFSTANIEARDSLLTYLIDEPHIGMKVVFTKKGIMLYELAVSNSRAGLLDLDSLTYFLIDCGHCQKPRTLLPAPLARSKLILSDTQHNKTDT